MIFRNTRTKTHRTIIVSRVWPSLREEHKLSVPRRVLRKLLGPTSDETEGRRHVRNEGFRDLYCSLNTTGGDQTVSNQIGGACGTYGREERCTRHFSGGT